MNDEERQRLLDAILDPAAQNKVIVGGPRSPVDVSRSGTSHAHGLPEPPPVACPIVSTERRGARSADLARQAWWPDMALLTIATAQARLDHPFNSTCTRSPRALLGFAVSGGEARRSARRSSRRRDE